MAIIYHLDSGNLPVIPVEDSNGNAVDFSTVTRFVAVHNGINGNKFTIDTDIDPGTITGDSEGNITFDYSDLIEITAPNIRTFGELDPTNHTINDLNGHKEIFLKPDGTMMWTSDDDNNWKQEWTLSTAWDLSTATKTATFTPAFAAQDGFWFNPNGTQLFMGYSVFTDSVIREYTLSTAWDITTASETGKTFNTGPQQFGPRAIRFSPDGINLYALNTGDDIIRHWTCSTAFDIATATLTSDTFEVVALQADGNFVITDDGLELYYIEDSSTPKLQLGNHTLSTPWDLTTAGPRVNVGRLTGRDSPGQDMGFAVYDDPPRIYVCNGANFIDEHIYGIVLGETTTFNGSPDPDVVRTTYSVTLTAYSPSAPEGEIISHECCGPHLYLEVC